MAKRRSSFGAEVEEKDKKKISKEGIKHTLSIFRFVLPYKGVFLIGMIFLVASQATSMSFPLLMGKMVGAINGHNPSELQKMSFLIMGIMALQAIFSFFRVYTFTRVSERAMRDLRRSLYAKMISLPIQFFEKHRVGELMSRITSDITQLQDVLSVTLAEFFRQTFTLIGGIIIISTISGKLTLFMLLTFPVLVIAAFIFGRFIRKNAKKTQDELAKTNVIVEETLQSINVVKAFTNERYEVNRYENSLQTVIEYALKAATFRGGFISFVIFAIFGGIVAVVWYGGTLVQLGELKFESLFSFIFYTAFIGGSVGGLGDMYAQLQRTVGASERILEILGEHPEIETDKVINPIDIKGDVAFKDVGFNYPSRPEVKVLQGISITAKAGEKIALVGPSGTGKSTIVQLLMRLYQPQSGSILVDNIAIDQFDLSAFRQNIAIVPQEVMLFGGTIYENIAYGKPTATEAEIKEAARKANALSFIETFPDQLQTLVGERGVKLSGGQRQRIAIARAILKDPAILILDEATSALDSESEKLVQDALDGLMQGRTTIIIAHRLATIRNVDNIYVLQNGHVVESGTHEQLLLHDNGLYANLVKLQFEIETV
jgi:ATP-binding cassette, subfamily B, bacterial